MSENRVSLEGKLFLNAVKNGDYPNMIAIFNENKFTHDFIKKVYVESLRKNNNTQIVLHLFDKLDSSDRKKKITGIIRYLFKERKFEKVQEFVTNYNNELFIDIEKKQLTDKGKYTYNEMVTDIVDNNYHDFVYLEFLIKLFGNSMLGDSGVVRHILKSAHMTILKFFKYLLKSGAIDIDEWMKCPSHFFLLFHRNQDWELFEMLVSHYLKSSKIDKTEKKKFIQKYIENTMCVKHDAGMTGPSPFNPHFLSQIFVSYPTLIDKTIWQLIIDSITNDNGEYKKEIGDFFEKFFSSFIEKIDTINGLQPVLACLLKKIQN